jgi:CO/xanthine dehydrogenase Mo-binding subunit
LLKGGGRYVDDLVLPRMAFGYVLRSPHAHAKIRSIDTARASAAPAVLLILTGEDWKRSGWGDLPVPGGQRRRDGTPMYRSPYPALAQKRVRWVGDYVAFVIAETYAQAADAAELSRFLLSPRRLTRLPQTRRASGMIAQTISASCISQATRKLPIQPSRAPSTWCDTSSW